MCVCSALSKAHPKITTAKSETGNTALNAATTTYFLSFGDIIWLTSKECNRFPLWKRLCWVERIFRTEIAFSQPRSVSSSLNWKMSLINDGNNLVFKLGIETRIVFRCWVFSQELLGWLLVVKVVDIKLNFQLSYKFFGLLAYNSRCHSSKRGDMYLS